MPHQIPSSLKSPIADRIRQTPRDRLDLPELIVPDSYETDQYAGVVNCVCPDCHDRISFPIDLAGLTASCPQCGGYVDVPELAGGRRETLVSQWNNRARLTAGDDPWKKHNLPGRWRLYSVSIALLMATGLVLGSNRIISPEILAAIMFGGLLGIFFTRWWIELKSLERGIPSLLKSSDD